MREPDATDEQGALYNKAIAPATQGLANEVPEVFEYEVPDPEGKYTLAPGAPKSIVVCPYAENVRTSLLLVAVTETI
jgi:hypothetical protein